MTKFGGINHLALITPDMETTVRFYRDVLGLPLVAAIGNEQFRHYFFDLGNHNTIAFFEWPGVIDIGTEKGAGTPGSGRQFDHLSFHVESEEALRELQARLREQGVEVTRFVDHDFIQSIYFTDPHGISLEASYWVRDITDQPNTFSDPNPVPALREQLEGKVAVGAGKSHPLPF